MSDDKKAENCEDGPSKDKGYLFISKLAGPEGVKTAIAACHAREDGRFGHEGLMAAKLLLHDIPVHQFSSGDAPKPAGTPIVKTTESKAKGK